MTTSMIPAPGDLSRQFATAYYDAALAGADMRNVANTLEALLDQLRRATDPYVVWAAMDNQIGNADLNRFMPALVQLRNEFQSAFISLQVAHLERIFAEDSQKGWTEWLSAYTRSFDTAGWRVQYATAIAERALRYSPHADWTVERIQKAAQTVRSGRWPEAYDWFLFLAGLELPAEYRAKFFAIAGEIQIFHFFQLTKARTLIEKALELAPNELQARYAWGEYWTARNRSERACEIYSQLVKDYPKNAAGYVGLGDCDEKTGQLAAAQTQYYQAVLNAPGYPLGYSSLTLLLLRPDQQKERVDPPELERLIQPFYQRWQALIEEPVVASVWVGVSYKNRDELEEARRYFQEAIQGNAAYATPYVWLGYTDMDEAEKQRSDRSTTSRLYSSAKKNFTSAVEIAPGTLDGYWGLSWLSMQEENWIAAEDWANRCLSLHREWESFVLVRRAEICRRESRLKEAEEDLFRSLALESVNQAALDALSFLVDDYHAKGDQNAARQLLDGWLRLSDPASAYLYHNKLGNWSYEAGDYPSAVEAYRQAVQAKDTDPVLHSNLAGAIEKLQVPGQRLQELAEAIAELRRANELQPDPDYEARLASFRREEEFLRVYGEAAVAFDPVVVPIRADIDWTVMPELLVSEKGDLSPATTTAVQAVRSSLKQKFGFTLPGISFRDIRPPVSGKYYLTFNESTIYQGALTAGSVCSTVLAHLEQAVTDHMAEFLGHDHVTALLKKSTNPASQAIVQDTGRLTRFVGLLKKKLKGRESIEPIDAICEAFLQGDQSKSVGPKPNPNDPAVTKTLGHNGFPQLALRMGGPQPKDANRAGIEQLAPTEIENEWETLRKTLFNELGVAVPQISYQHDATLPERTTVLLLNQKEVLKSQNADLAAIHGLMQNSAADLMVSALTEYYLTKLRARYRVLIRAVETQLPIRESTMYLKHRLYNGLSIKNLPGVLEDQLQEWQSNQAGWQAIIGNVCYRQEEYEDAISAFQRAVSLAPENADYYNLLGNSLCAKKAYHKAIEAYRQAVALAPQSSIYHSNLGNALTWQGDGVIDLSLKEKHYQEAVEELERAAQVDPSAVNVRLELAKAYARLGRYSDAVTVFEGLSSDENSNKVFSEFLSTLRNAMEVAGRLSRDPQNASLHATMAAAHLDLGNTQQAISEYQQAVALEPTNPEHHKKLGTTLFKLGAWSGAAAAWEQCLALEPDNPLTINNLGTVYDRMGQTEKALPEYQRAANLSPTNFVPFYNLGTAHYRLGRIPEAMQALAESVKRRADFAPSHYNLGNCHYRLQHQNEAILEWEEAIRLNPAFEEARYNLGVILWSDETKANRERAVEMWEAALRSNRNFAAAEDNLEAVRQGGDPHLRILDLLS